MIEEPYWPIAIKDLEKAISEQLAVNLMLSLILRRNDL